jgi:hypothetical protein
MITFFPTPYPDEVLYSVLARYHIRSANFSPKITLRDLFNTTNIISTVDFPSHLQTLGDNLSHFKFYTFENIVKNSTLFPFYSPFLSAEKAGTVADLLRFNSRGIIHTKIGIMASSVKTPTFLRFCAECFNEDSIKYAEPYWHRLHQIPGVLICPVHQVLIQNSTVKTDGKNRHEFYQANAENCISVPISVNYDKTVLNRLIDLAEDVKLTLNSTLPSKNVEWFQQKYTSLLIEKGLATASERIHQKDFINEFKNFYGRSFLELVYSDFDSNRDSNWLSGIVRKHRKLFHPLRHLLLIRFLGQDVLTFFENKEVIRHQFGKGPWTCFNGATKHYLKKTISSISISYSTDMKRLVGTFFCDCGFVYSTSNHLVPYSQKLDYGKIKSFGTIWEKKLKRLLIDKKVSFREAGRKLKVTAKTIILHSKLLGLIAEKEEAKSQNIMSSKTELFSNLSTRQ